MASVGIFLCLIGVFVLLVVILVGISVRIVPTGMRLSVYRFGEFIGDKGPGIVIVIPFIDRAVLKKSDVIDVAANEDHFTSG